MTELGNSTKDVGLNALSKGTENKLYRERSEEPQEGYFPAMPGTLASTVFNPKPEKQIIEKKQDSGIGFLERMAAFSEMVRNKSLDMMEDIKKAFGNIGSFTPVNEGVEAGIVGVENYMNRAPMTPREQAVRREKEDIEDTPRARRREIINSPIVKSEDSNLDIDSIKPSSEPKNPSKEISNPTYKGYVHSGPGF